MGRGIAQEQLAYDSGIDRSYVGGLERATENPTVDLLERLCKTLHVPIAELFIVPARGARAPETLPRGRKANPSTQQRGTRRA